MGNRPKFIDPMLRLATSGFHTAAGAIHWGNPKGERLVVFSDFQCGYCQRLTAELAKAKVMIEERPISIFGAASRKISEAVLCRSEERRVGKGVSGRVALGGSRSINNKKNKTIILQTTKP